MKLLQMCNYETNLKIHSLMSYRQYICPINFVALEVVDRKNFTAEIYDLQLYGKHFFTILSFSDPPNDVKGSSWGLIF